MPVHCDFEDGWDGTSTTDCDLANKEIIGIDRKLKEEYWKFYKAGESNPTTDHTLSKGIHE